MARELFKIGDTIQFLRDDPEKNYNEQKIYEGKLTFIADCKKWVSVWPHNFPKLKMKDGTIIEQELVVEATMFTSECARGKKL